MLILTRKPGEALVIDDKIRLTVVSVRGNQVRIGIDAPDDVNVYREEILGRLDAPQESEAAVNPHPRPK